MEAGVMAPAFIHSSGGGWSGGALEGPQELEEGPDPEAGASLGDVAVVGLGPGRAGDVEMSPRHVADELPQEQPGAERAGLTGCSHVLDVGDLRVDVLAVPVRQR